MQRCIQVDEIQSQQERKEILAFLFHFSLKKKERGSGSLVDGCCCCCCCCCWGPLISLRKSVFANREQGSFSCRLPVLFALNWLQLNCYFTSQWEGNALLPFSLDNISLPSPIYTHTRFVKAFFFLNNDELQFPHSFINFIRLPI